MAGADYYLFQPWNAALMSQVSGSASYCSYAVAQTDTAVAAEEALIAAGQAPQVAGDDYLDIGQTVGNLAIVYDWCRPQMSTSQRTRWTAYANQAVWNVWNFNQAKWGAKSLPWSGWAVDDPSDNYYYSFLRATMLLGVATLGENPQAQGWIDKFRTEKVAGELAPTFNSDLVGGGSREGTGYGVAMKGLFDLYYWWEKSTGERIADLTPHTLASFDKMAHDIVPTMDRLAPTGDQSRDSTASLFDYHREYLEILSRLYPSDPMAGVSKTLLAASSVPTMSQGFESWIDYVYDQSDIAAQPLSRLSTARWGSGTGQFTTRSSWTTDAGWANFICGPYTQSHAHRDQGSFLLYRGAWLAFDEDIDTHSGLAQEEEPHNLVRVVAGGQTVPQTYGASCSMRALADTPAYSYAFADATPMYAGQPSVVKVQREFLFIKPGTLVVLDRVGASVAGAQRVWTLNLPAAPSVSGDNLSLVQGSHRLDVARLAPAGIPWQTVSWPAADADMNAGVRMDASDSAGTSSVFLHVLGTDSSVVSATRSDSGSMIGVQISLSDGRAALARFSSAGTGGTLEIRDGGGNVISAGPLPTTVQAPPRLAN